MKCEIYVHAYVDHQRVSGEQHRPVERLYDGAVGPASPAFPVSPLQLCLWSHQGAIAKQYLYSIVVFKLVLTVQSSLIKSCIAHVLMSACRCHSQYTWWDLLLGCLRPCLWTHIWAPFSSHWQRCRQAATPRGTTLWPLVSPSCPPSSSPSWSSASSRKSMFATEVIQLIDNLNQC
jgi:hypothetical protein